MSETQIIKDFHTNIITFLDELIEQFPTEADLILLRLFLKDSISPIQIINMFIKEVLPYKENIIKRDVFDIDIQLGNSAVINKTRINHFKMLWKSSALDEDDRDIIWKWIDTFVFLAEKYQKIKLV
jgi:hypothetical protein